MDEELSRGVHDLHERVEQLDDLLRSRVSTADLRERRADAAHQRAEENSHRIRRLWLAGLAVALLWTPSTAYGAVWMHERIRNHCYPGVMFTAENPPAVEAWYCNIFPGTGRHSAPPP